LEFGYLIAYTSGYKSDFTPRLDMVWTTPDV
jgi:hypothetical protein